MILLLPAAVFAADGTSEGFGFLSSLVQMIAALAVVVGLILVLSLLGGRWLNAGGGPAAGQRYIRLVETRYLAPKKSLFLVEVAGEYLLLASSGEQLNFVKQIDMVEEIEVIGGIEERQTIASTFWERLRRTTRPLSSYSSVKSGTAGSEVGR
ncbi:FliO/MopB family protein [Geobacter argillaceus]|nr:flagellar biosynthetic protein FliO [Geobacter argillaceus]